MSNTKAPLENEVWFVDGKPTKRAYIFFSQISTNNAIINQGFFNYKQSYQDLVAINADIPNPDNWLSVLTNQGIAVYNPNIAGGTWVLASDNTTPVT